MSANLFYLQLSVRVTMQAGDVSELVSYEEYVTVYVYKVLRTRMEFVGIRFPTYFAKF